jgi:hypothetical protein
MLLFQLFKDLCSSSPCKYPVSGLPFGGKAAAKVENYYLHSKYIHVFFYFIFFTGQRNRYLYRKYTGYYSETVRFSTNIFTVQLLSGLGVFA